MGLGLIGCSMKLGTVVPGIQKIRVVKLSREAKVRLSWVEYYYKCSNGVLTCRHFGIARSTLQKWQDRYDPDDLRSLESLPRTPKRKRESMICPQTIALVKKLRKQDPDYSKYKLSVILRRDYQIIISPSSVGRILKKYKLTVKRGGRRVQPLVAGRPRTTKPKGLKADRPGHIFEFDLKHLPVYEGGRKLYAFVTIDIFTRKTAIMVSATTSATQAAMAWQLATKELGTPEILITDSGSENFGKFAKTLKESSTTHYFV